MPNGDQYRMTMTGRLVKKEEAWEEKQRQRRQDAGAGQGQQQRGRAAAAGGGPTPPPVMGATAAKPAVRSLPGRTVSK